jgi:nucleotide-binding universal stress UspA family protein
MSAVRVAIELTQSLGSQARLHVASVVDYAGVPNVLAKQPAGAPDLLAEQAHAALDDARTAVLAAGFEPEVHLLHGEVVEALLACATNVGADIVVAGFHGQNRLARIVMGSVVGKLVRSTTLPVVVVRSLRE